MLIGLCGKMGSGKTSVGNWLESEKGFLKMAFADGLKNMLLIAGMDTRDNLWGSNKPTMTRWLLQKIGTDIIRNQIDNDFWVKALAEDLDFIMKAAPKADIVVDDVRFPNELKAISERFGIAVWVEIEGEEPTPSSPLTRHASEVSVGAKDCDYVISAKYGNLEQLYEQIESIMEYKDD
jgi:hypothetical protein